MLVGARDYEKALAKFDQAERVYQNLGMEVEAARMARSKIGVLLYLDRYAEALATAEPAPAARRLTPIPHPAPMSRC